VLSAPEIDTTFAAAWNALPAARGVQADIYDSHAWFSSWLAASADAAQGTRVVAVLDGDRPVAVLPIVGRGSRWSVAGAEMRPRARPVIGSAEPDDEVLAVLVDGLGSAGVREIGLHRLPSRDPATAALTRLLGAAGYRVAARERSCDRLATVEGGWPGHSRRFKSFAQYTKRFTSKITPYWELALDEYGTSPDRPVADAFAIYRDLQARSWKDAFPPQVARQRAALLDVAQARGWARLYLLRIAGVPVAGHIWFRLGDVATWMSTAHDKDLGVLSPGTIVQWWSQERVFAGEPPRLVDYLPGASQQKERLAPETPALLAVDAARRLSVAGVTLPARLEARRLRVGVATRLQARGWRRAHEPSGAVVTTGQMSVAPAVDTGHGLLPVDPLDVDPAVTRYLAAATGAASAKSASESWAEDDRWWRVGDEPHALVRLSADGVVRDVVQLHDCLTVGGVVSAVAAAIGGPLTIMLDDHDDPVGIHRPRIPWPDVWRGRPVISDALATQEASA
jgi:hypothetical protein